MSDGADGDLLNVEQAVRARTQGLDLDHRAMAVLSNIFRVSTAIRRSAADLPHPAR